MLLELAIGDAYGAGFEYVDRQFVRQFNDLSRYIKHPRHEIIPGYYTDDTQMTLAIAEAILSGEEWTPLNLARRFVKAFKRDPREGYARGFYDFLQRIEDGDQFLEQIVPTSDKSGAAMRASPIGVFANVDEVIEKATIQSAITHNTPEGIRAGIASALMSHYFIHRRGPRNGLGEFIAEYVEGDWAEPWHGKVKAKGWMSVQAAITAIHQHERLSDILRACVDFLGDADTVATIALGAASNSDDIIHDLPDNLVLTLENGSFGRDYIVELDRQLVNFTAKHNSG